MKKLLFALSTAGLLLAMLCGAHAQSSAVKTVSVYAYAGAPVATVTEIDTLTLGGTPTGGTFTISIANGRTSAPITWSATNATLVANVQAALVAMDQIGAGGCTVAVGTATAGIGTFTITFAGKNLGVDFPALSATSSLTGTSPTAAIATTTPGAAGTFRNAPPGTILIDSLTPGLYVNSSATLNAPTWTAK